MVRRALPRIVALAFAAALAACADDPAPAPAPLADAIGDKQVIARVDRIEMGRTHSGHILTAYGAAEGMGWSRPQLRPRTGMTGPDGYVVFDMVATPPPPPAPPARGAQPIPPPPGLTQKLRADTVAPDAMIATALGVRVFGLAGGAEITFVVQP